MAGEGNWYDLRVYVGNIGRYNEGSLVGGWATLPMGRDDLDAFLRDRVGIDGERYEEYRIDDFDLPDWLPAGPGERVIDERTSLEDLNVMAGVLSTLDEDDAAKARIWIEE
ncbi:antirestriction protein ArdA, partial [Bilophila wadsworthia]